MIENKEKISYERKINLFLTQSFLMIGLNNANIGTYYFKELIKLAYFKNIIDIKYKDLCLMLSKKLNISIYKIESNIYTSINSININIAKRNFKDIFSIEFDYFYVSPKKLTILFLNLLYNKFY